jgi:hypothetical protein
MSVYAAEALRELPVVAEPAQPDAEEQLNFRESAGFSQNATTEQNAEDAATQRVEPAEEPRVESAELTVAPVQQGGPPDESSIAVQDASSAALETSESLEHEVPAAESAPEQQALTSIHSESVDQSESPAGTEQARSTIETTEPAQIIAKSRWVAENVAVSAEEAALELEREMQQTQVVAAVEDSSPQDGEEYIGQSSETEAQERTTQPTSPVTEEVAAVAEPSESNGATFAAAASASASGSEAVSTPAVSTSSLDPEPHAGSEAAAAWENWRHIRDSVMGSQTAVQLSDGVTETVQATALETASSPDLNASQGGEGAQGSQNAEATSEDSDAADLSSIVDTMLAELKPKLMAEIAKKLKK